MYNTKHPDGTAHAGTAILIKSRLRHHELQQYRTDQIQATNICLKEWSGSFIISAVYCPPKHAIKKNEFITFFNTLGDKFLAGGDYNAKHTKWGSRLTTAKGKQLNEAMEENVLDFVSSGHPTYWPTDTKKIPDLLDFCITKNITRTYVTAENCYDLSSDHSPVIITLTTNVLNKEPFKHLTNKYTNWKLYRHLVEHNCNINISLKTKADIDESVENLSYIIKEAAIESTDIKSTKKIKINFSSKEIQELVNEKRKIRRQWQMFRSPSLKYQLNKAIKLLRRTLHEEHNNNLANYLQDLTATEATDYSLWKATKKMKRPTTLCPPIRKNDGSWARSDQEKCDIFATHLENVFQPNLGNYEHMHPDGSLSPKHIPLKFKWKQVKNVINDQLNPKKAPGHDHITIQMIRELPEAGIKLITSIFNAIMRLGYFPKNWKISEVIMILKPGKDATVASSYRPISLLPSLSKLFEKTLLQKLHPIMEQEKIIPDHQFGFREQHSTIEQVHRIINEIKCALDGKKYCSAIFLDIAQAFDKVWHTGLLYKIRKYLPNNFHAILESYLSHRKFQVKYNESISRLCGINAGIPQGSVLGPILYLIYTADLPTSNNIVTSTFADDTAILATNKNPQTASRELQEHLLKIDDWLKKWRIKVNETKSAHVTFTLNKRTCPKVRLNNVHIPQKTEVKYLGLYLDRRLTWKKHIEMKRKQVKIKFSKLYWMLGRNSKLSLDCKLLLYKSIIMPVWTYGIQLWGTTSASNKDRLQKTQSKILRCITNAPWYIRNSNIHADLGIPTVEKITELYSMKYKSRLEHHPNSFARNLINTSSYKRLKRKDPIDLMN